ncbi:MAG: hypothetical protein BMS9Abin05_1313 [Rhodothermia bacterium]|nr:MAG: hypothetical protein BMS9Abin05_1313 [Rhodothermia bacterium]
MNVRHLFLFFAFLLTALTVSLLLTGCNRTRDKQAEPELSYLNWSPEIAYVGRDACQQCHRDKYESFIKSQMGRSWKPARLSLSDADFDNPEPIYAPNQDLYYQPFSSGEDLFVREYRIAGGDTVHNRVEQIAYIVGSGQHTNSHIMDINGYLYQIPVTWYVQDGKWDLAPGFSGRNSRFSRPIPDACMTCHNGKSPLVPGSENKFASVAEGIGCERCHGPGSLHIEAITEGKLVDVSREVDRTIVNPGKLTPERQWDLCSRCHLQGVDVFRNGILPDDFRPGRALAEYQNVYWPRQPDSVRVFNMASHPDRLSMSECYAASWREGSKYEPLTCTSCHDPHVPIEKKLEVDYSAVCQSCHIAGEIPVCTEPSVVAGTTDLECASCHMPVSKTADIPNVRITDHFIRVPDEQNAPLTEQEAADQIRIIRMASFFDDKPTATDLARGLMSYYEKITDRPEMLDRAAKALARARLTEESDQVSAAQIWLWYLQSDYPSIRRFVNEQGEVHEGDAWTQFRIGEAYRASGELERAIIYLERAIDLAPEHLRMLDRLAATYTNLGQFEAAIARFDQILQANPKFESSVNNRGFAYLLMGEIENAELDFKDAIALDPDAEVALANLASLYANTDRHAQARPLVRRLLILAPDNPDYNILWREVNP